MKKKDIGRFRNLTTQEHDSCGILAVIEKDGQPRRENVLEAIEYLIKLEHRSGFINGEGDGCGLLTDLPREIWKDRLAAHSLSTELATDPRFAVAHLFIPKLEHTVVTKIQKDIRSLITQAGITILCEEMDRVNSQVLGKNGRMDEPHFWQIACLGDQEEGLTQRIFSLTVAIEKKHPVHIASFSPYTVVYKLMGSANRLPKYFYDLNNEKFRALATIGHNRYSTNTRSNFVRVQPFSLIGHNGEINTIEKLREEAKMIGTTLTQDGSDSQDLNRLLETLIHQYNLTLFEALEITFPPIIHEIKGLPKKYQDLYMYYRQAWGPFAQGPAGIVSRYANECAFRVDALGFRPLWKLENERSLIFSSEQGLIPVYKMVSEPKPIAPGETIGVRLLPEAEELTHDQFQQTVYERTKKRANIQDYKQFISTYRGAHANETSIPASKADYAAFGWDREQIQMVESMATNGADPIRSIGHDAPLAVLANARQNIADYVKESVAVVTNPAIDREREIEHFSTRVVIGRRPLFAGDYSDDLRFELPSPIVVEGIQAQEVCSDFDTLSYEALLDQFARKDQVAILSLSFKRNTSLRTRLEELADEAVTAVQNGKVLIVLDDAACHKDDQLFLDPHLAIAKVDQALKEAKMPNDPRQSLRRYCNIVVRSGAMRNLHDLAVAIGLGANVISPYLMFRTIINKEGKTATHLFDAIRKGLEKIISTIGIHELRGYSRLFSAIGLHFEIADMLGIVNYGGTEQVGLSFAQLEQEAEARYEDFHSAKAKAASLYHLWPRVWKPIGQVASGAISYEELANKFAKLEQENPTSLRHVLDLRVDKHSKIDPEEVDLSIADHDLPMVISSMSFGSQGEVAFRAYAEAAERLNMVSLNGEGGEIKDMLGKYPHTRGHQIASGRFGITVELANSANLLEIKIGQGAKPGEGGHLPGKKVSTKVAAARNAQPGSDLISPSNNHDIYSIEDLAQMITELKTANPRAKVIVKVPIVPNIGTIAVGIAKAGADIITLSGFDGGTGAARIHALQHVGLPAEIGVKAAHHALIEAGIRDQVELWADGGMKSALDAVKLILLGANRIGFGTLAMIAIGCTACRGCHLDTCHVGIATQIETKEQADAHGLRRFVPRQFDVAVESLMRLFQSFAEEMKRLTAQLGARRLQDLVGRSDLLEQTRALDRLDLSDLLALSPYPWSNKEKQVIEDRVQQELLLAVGAGQLTVNETLFEQPTQQVLTDIQNEHRVMISNLSGARVQSRLDGSYRQLPPMKFSITNGSIPGNGLASYHAEGIHVTVQGGAQDGVGKTAFGGRVAILKSLGKNKVYINGSVGKSFCYGAQKGLFLVQGNADSRAGIRLSGADVVIGGEVTSPLRDELGMIASRANIKGFAFEYMTDGRAVVLGDPGPWICSGMTGGVVYLRYQPELGLTKEALERRIAKAAKVKLEPLNEQGIEDLHELLGEYYKELKASGQFDVAARIQKLSEAFEEHFLQVIPVKQQADPSVSTE